MYEMYEKITEIEEEFDLSFSLIRDIINDIKTRIKNNSDIIESLKILDNNLFYLKYIFSKQVI